MRINQKLIERIMDKPFTVKWQDKSGNEAIVSVEGLKDMRIKVDENFRIDCGKWEVYGQRQRAYLETHYYDISKKLMELSGMSSDEIEAHLEKLKTERVMTVTSFLREFKPKYKNFNVEFCSFVKRHHLDARGDDTFYTFPIKALKESWEKFYTGGDRYADRPCLFDSYQYLDKMDKDNIDREKWDDFLFHSPGSIHLEYGFFFSLRDLDKAFEKFESSLGKVEDSIENMLAENFANELKNLQKEGLFENVKSFDLDFNGRGINIKLNESQPGNRNVSFKKRSNLKENETNEVTYAQDFLGEDIDISELKEAAAEAGISLEIYEGSGNNGCDEIYVTASSEEALKEFLYDWWLIENDDDFEAGLLD